MLSAATGLMLGQAVLPYTFTTAELDSLKSKLMTAEQQINTSGKGQHTVLQISLSEIKTLLRMIDMTYLQGLSASGYLPTGPTIPTGLAATTQSSQVSNLQSNMGSLNSGAQPPSNYVCHRCGIAGHYVQDCPNATTRQSSGHRPSHRGPPPANYVCHKCNKPGHWIQDCPMRQQNGMMPQMGNMGGNLGGNMNNMNNMGNMGGAHRYGHQQNKAPIDYNKPPPTNYICHRCHVPGHWIKNCPTNGDPAFDKTNGTNTNTNSNPNPSIQSLPSQPTPTNSQPSQVTTLTQSTTQPSSVTNVSSAASNNDTGAEPPAAKKRRLNSGAAQ